MKHREIAYVAKKTWGPDDDYLIIPVGNIQVFAEDGWKPGQRVEVVVEVKDPIVNEDE